MKRYFLFALTIGIVVSAAAVLGLRHAFTSGSADAFVEFKTAQHTYVIPSTIAIPESVFNEPLDDINDKFGPSVDLTFGRQYLADLGIDIDGVQDPNADFFFTDGLFFTVARPKASDRDFFWMAQRKSEPVTLTGEFSQGVFEYDDRLNLYRVFRSHEEQVDGMRWDLVSVKPDIKFSSNGYKNIWIADCQKYEISSKATCTFEREVLDFLVLVSGSEDDYLVMSQVDTVLASHFNRWKEAITPVGGKHLN